MAVNAAALTRRGRAAPGEQKFAAAYAKGRELEGEPAVSALISGASGQHG
ncbi:hypothetical protein [Nonomuraea endophytica]|uniref:Uncharacterized protein n=1 Tax=Nonomuraea endophytica TaxID=714136 RepID=A0A7W8A8E5_9ACTN|nr:hypothetical protein [Nonomuraea endophytica]MBB5081527.1 hypothetical protein [Nonomuraea endophytica]